MRQVREKPQTRMALAGAILAIFFAFLVGRLYYLQIVQGLELARRALALQTTGYVLEQYPRGEILDRYGRSLSGGFWTSRLVVFPALLEDKEGAVARLAPILNAPPAAVRACLERGGVGQWDLRPDQAARIADLALPGVLVAPYRVRYGPRPLAVHLTGYLGRVTGLDELEKFERGSRVAYTLEDYVGRQGLEAVYEGWLHGRREPAAARFWHDARQRQLSALPVQVQAGADTPPGPAVLTTLDAGVQAVVEQVMDKHVTAGAVVVLDPRSGDVLAMASRPAFDPRPGAVRLPETGSTAEGAYINRALALFPPGSLFKIVVLAAALQEGVARPDSEFFCDGARARPVRCWYGAGHGWETLQQAFANSCNPVFVELGRRLGADGIIRYARALGLDRQVLTGYNYPVDSRQDLAAIARPYNLANSSVGQGPVLVTPLQVAAAVAALVNDGVWRPPRLVAALLDEAGREHRLPAGRPEQAISPATAAAVREMMQAVTERGTGREAWLPGLGSAGKTGSAQVAGRQDVYAWFAGYAPLQQPRYVIVVLVAGGKSGGETAAPLFREIAARLVAR
ncbi:MAG: peptidoglycan D,D-transpeptidase FtsI family protein [Desulfurispora sp.]|uniref:peptidoglycan D,D-transpeptidase FtsI family protein n=1 Tax=Desulfurispora sp. TaxID=3014275 RepID=UPI004049EB0E